MWCRSLRARRRAPPSRRSRRTFPPQFNPAAAEETCDRFTRAHHLSGRRFPRAAGAERPAAGGPKASTLFFQSRRGKAGRPFSAKTEKAPRGGLLLPRVPIGCIVVCQVFKNGLSDSFRTHIGIVVCIESMCQGMTVRAQCYDVVRSIETTFATGYVMVELQISSASA